MIGRHIHIITAFPLPIIKGKGKTVIDMNVSSYYGAKPLLNTPFRKIICFRGGLAL